MHAHVSVHTLKGSRFKLLNIVCAHVSVHTLKGIRFKLVIIVCAHVSVHTLKGSRYKLVIIVCAHLSVILCSSLKPTLPITWHPVTPTLIPTSR